MGFAILLAVNVLAAAALWLGYSTPRGWIWWAVAGLIVFTYLCNEAVRNNARAQTIEVAEAFKTGEKDPIALTEQYRRIGLFWAKVSMASTAALIGFSITLLLNRA